MTSSGKYCQGQSLMLSSLLLSQCCGWARLWAKKRSCQSLWLMRLPPYSQDGKDKKRGYPSGGRPCPRWSVHVKAILLRAQCTRRYCCTFPVSLSLSLSLSLSSALGLSNALCVVAPLQLPCATLRRLWCTGLDCFSLALYRFLLLNSRTDKLHSYSHLSIPLFIRLPCYPYIQCPVTLFRL